MNAQTKRLARIRRHRRVRKKIAGTAARPRLAVFRSSKHIYAQLIDDEAGTTLASASTMDKDAKADRPGTVAAAEAVGKAIAEKAKQAGIERVVFDRGGFQYHGRVAAVAEAAREAGLEL